MRQHKPPERTAINLTSKRLIEASDEIYVASASACSQADYLRLGGTDSALILGTGEDILLTAYAAAYFAASSKGIKVINFNHERERFGLV